MVNKNTHKGFTLIELLVVIAIIGILSAVVLVSLNSSRLKARDAKRISDIDAFKTALTLYADSNSSHYPTSLNELATSHFIPGSTAPNDPQGVAYLYTKSSDGLSYHLGATLEQNNIVLNSDRDCSSKADATPTSEPPLCRGFGTAGVATGFDGAPALVYDVTP